MNLTAMTIEQIYTVNAPLRANLDARIPLSTDEQELHSCICAEVMSRLDSLRIADRNERDARLAARYTRPACEISQDEAAGLNGFYSGVEN